MAKKNSRTTNTIFNFTSSIGGQLITIVMKFVVRTVFINTLGRQYLGIGGLFSNILSMLSLVDLGVGSAILYKLYEPIAKDDHKRIASLMRFYKTIFRIIGLVVLAIGLCMIPFLPYLAKDYDKLSGLNINATFIFILYLLESVSSYLFFAYKSAIIKANQKEYLVTVVGYFFTIGAGILQMILLVLFHNFELYVTVTILKVIGHNVVCAIIADRQYPYINDKSAEKISKEEFRDILKDCGSLFLYKMNSVVVKATDNLVLSVFMGLEIVGVYSNYYIFYTTIRTLFGKIFNSVSHSLGNLHTTHDSKHEYSIFESVMLVSAILGGTAFAGIAVVGDECVQTWIGNDWLLPQPFAILMGLELYTAAFKMALSKYRTTMGLFQQAKFRPLAGMLINLGVSIALVNVWGICGVLVGTIASDWLTFMWFDPLIIHKHGFGEGYSVFKYYFKFLRNFVIACAVGAVDMFICKHFFVGYGWFSVIVHACIVGVTVPAALIAVSVKNDEGRYIIGMLKRSMKKVGKKMGRKKA